MTDNFLLSAGCRVHLQRQLAQLPNNSNNLKTQLDGIGTKMDNFTNRP
jgi:hypothetical protein